MSSARQCPSSVGWKCRTEQIEVGSWQEIVLDYEVGGSGLADGAWIKATFKFYSDWALFQTIDPQGAPSPNGGRFVHQPEFRLQTTGRALLDTVEVR